MRIFGSLLLASIFAVVALAQGGTNTTLTTLTSPSRPTSAPSPPTTTSATPTVTTKSVPSTPATSSALPATATSSAPPKPATSSAPPKPATSSAPPKPATSSAPPTLATGSAPPTSSGSGSGAPSLPTPPATSGSGPSRSTKPTSTGPDSGTPSLSTPPTPTDSASGESSPSIPSPATTTTRSPEELEHLVVEGLEQVPNITTFSGIVEEQPEIFDLLNPDLNYTIFAPNDTALGQDTGGEGADVLKAKLAFAFVEQKAGDPPLTDGPKTLTTALEDPEYVNLGPGVPAKLVSFPEGPDTISILGGMGKRVTFQGEGNEFGGGAVHVGDDYFTLPEDLSTTLRGTNGTAFEKFLSTSGELDGLSTTAGITIFALTDDAVTSAGNRLTKTTLEQQVVRDTAKYSPDFVEGTTLITAGGGSIKITVTGSSYFVNGIKIVTSDRIMKNGVVHYVEDIIPSSAGRSSISPFITLLAVVVGLSGSYMMD